MTSLIEKDSFPQRTERDQKEDCDKVEVRD